MIKCYSVFWFNINQKHKTVFILTSFCMKQLRWSTRRNAPNQYMSITKFSVLITRGREGWAPHNLLDTRVSFDNDIRITISLIQENKKKKWSIHQSNDKTFRAFFYRVLNCVALPSWKTGPPSKQYQIKKTHRLHMNWIKYTLLSILLYANLWWRKKKKKRKIEENISFEVTKTYSTSPRNRMWDE